MIDATTLPTIQANEQIVAGRRFIVVGEGFDRWPDEIVLGYDEDRVLEGELPSYQLLRLVSKTDTELVFEAMETHRFGVEHIFVYFGAGFEVPRSILQYDEM